VEAASNVFGNGVIRDSYVIMILRFYTLRTAFMVFYEWLA
jgi:hypothetical protein